MEKHRGAKSVQGLLVTSYLVAGMSAAGGELRTERVREDVPSPRLEIWREEDGIPPEWLEDEPSEPEWEDAPEDEADALGLFSLQEAPLAIQVDPERPELLRVPGQASREEIASRLFGDASAVDAFAFEPRAVPPDTKGRPRVCVRVHQPGALLPGLLADMRGALDARVLPASVREWRPGHWLPS